jgi:hypothetical protein
MTATDPLVDIPIRDVSPSGLVIVDVRTFVDVRAKVEHLAELVRAGAMRSDGYSAGPIARLVLGSVEQCHAWVRDRIAYTEEPSEMLETAAFIARERRGDCDGQAVLVATLVLCLGGSAILVPQGGKPDDPAHLVTLVKAGGGSCHVAPWQPFGLAAPAGWQWAETTLRGARFGETPSEAARRLKPTGRADLGHS